MSNSAIKSEIRGWISSTKKLVTLIESNKLDSELKLLVKQQLEALQASLEVHDENRITDG